MTDVFTFHKRFSSDEFDAQYNLRAGRPDYEETVIPKWQQESETARNNLKCRLDIRYGDAEKQKLDVFSCGEVSAPTLIYFHGGYWQRGDKSIYSFLATPFVVSGANVVVVGYDLCPAVTITQISEEAREAIAFIWRNASELGLNQKRLTVMGHSAGGHITQMMMGTSWSQYASDLPDDLIAAGILVSPLSYLEPVRLTQALNAGIRMDPDEAERESPMINHHPATNAPQIVAVGGAETGEFKRQAQMYVDAFATSERSIELYHVPDVDHFDELTHLQIQKAFFQKLRALLG